jgi:membrane-bound metal-dependent hydrolase YbcI (DUF457 family)
VNSRRLTRRRRAEAYADPALHAVVAAAVARPLGRRPLAAAVAASALIDLDHLVAARSLDTSAWLSLPRRPPTHSVAAVAASGALVGALGGVHYGWATFAGLLSHILRDAVDAETPLLWPWSGGVRLSERVLVLGTAGLILGSWALSRATAGRG